MRLHTLAAAHILVKLRDAWALANDLAHTTRARIDGGLQHVASCSTKQDAGQR